MYIIEGFLQSFNINILSGDGALLIGKMQASHP